MLMSHIIICPCAVLCQMHGPPSPVDHKDAASSAKH
jgi:hypothetical protein